MIKRTEPDSTGQSDGRLGFISLVERPGINLGSTIAMNALTIVGQVFGLFGFIFALGAWHRVAKLEAELKRRQLIDATFQSGQQ